MILGWILVSLNFFTAIKHKSFMFISFLKMKIIAYINDSYCSEFNLKYSERDCIKDMLYYL